MKPLFTSESKISIEIVTKVFGRLRGYDAKLERSF